MRDMTVEEPTQLSLDKQLSYALTSPELSDHARTTVSRYIKQKASSVHSTELTVKILDVACQSALHGPSLVVRNAAADVYQSWACANARLIHDYLLKNGSRRIRTWLGVDQGADEATRQPVGTATLAEWQGLVLLRLSVAALKCQPELQELLLHDISKYLSLYLRAHSGDIDDLSHVAEFLAGSSALLTRRPLKHVLAEYVWPIMKEAILSVACAEELRSTLATHSAKMPKVVQMFSCLWAGDYGKAEPDTPLTFKAVSEIFINSLHAEHGRQHLLLAPILQTIPVDQKQAMKFFNWLLNRENVYNENLVNLMQRLIAWMKWPQQTAISIWAMTLWDIIVSMEVSSVIEQVLPEIEKLVNYLNLPCVRASAARLLEKMFATQKGPHVFHKALPKLILVLPRLLASVPTGSSGSSSKGSCMPDDKAAAENQDEATLLAKAIVAFIHQQMVKYQGYPNLYKEAEALILGLCPDEPGDLNMDTDAKPFGKTGLRNPDSLSCYSNAVLQMLFASTRFRNDVLSASSVVANSKSVADQPMLGQLQQVFAFLAFSKRGSYNAHEFRATSLPPWFAGSLEQQDSHELLGYIVEQLNDQELANSSRQATGNNSASKVVGTTGSLCASSATEQPEAPTTGQPVVGAPFAALPAATRYQQLQQTLSAKYFKGCLTQTCRCHECGHVSSKAYVFSHLSVNLPVSDEGGTVQSDATDETRAETPPTIGSLLKQSLQDEQLETYRCDRCSSDIQATCSLTINSAPDNLFVTVSRFVFDRKTGGRSKISTSVSCDDRLLVPVASRPSVASTEADASLAGRSSSDTSGSGQAESVVEYRLRAVVVHCGWTPQSGHYTCFARHDSTEAGSQHRESKEGQWFVFDDESVRLSDFNSIPGNKPGETGQNRYDTPYILLYERLPAPMVPVQSTDTVRAAITICNATADGSSMPLEAAAAAAAAPGYSDTVQNSMLMDLVRNHDEEAVRRARLRGATAILQRSAVAGCRPGVRIESPQSRFSDDDDDEDGGGKRKYTGSSEQSDIVGSRFVF